MRRNSSDTLTLTSSQEGSMECSERATSSVAQHEWRGDCMLDAADEQAVAGRIHCWCRAMHICSASSSLGRRKTLNM